MEYNFIDIEKKWRKNWAEKKTFRAFDDSTKPKYYVLDMFPYPSGAGLHVGHPLGYIASDIYARYKRLQGYNVLHPMGYDSFGLPAEQYAIQTGQHPDKTTKENIARYREQLDKIGFSFDWDREVRTSDPNYYKWTQWIFIQLFNSWYNPRTNKAEKIETLISIFEKEGFKGAQQGILTGEIEKDLKSFSAEDWKIFDEKKRNEALMNFRLTYLGEAYVNWCPAMGTVLANDEVKDGFSERGGHPVERKLMKQWSMRITAYAQRLLDGLEKIDWTDSIRDQQRNWIGKSEGASLKFKIQKTKSQTINENAIEVFTTRPDTIFGVSFVTLAPEHDLVSIVTTAEQKAEVDAYVTKSKNRSERERMADVNTISGVFTGSYVEHPFTGEQIPIWVGDYVLVGYGTGAVMAVPAHDERDYKFAKHFNLPITQVIQPDVEHDFEKDAWGEKEGTIVNSNFLNGLDVKKAIKSAIDEIEKRAVGKRQINFRLRNAVFGRQRYWGEPIPVYYKNGTPYVLNENELPLTLPEVDKYLPTEDGEPPLARANNWKYKNEFDYEHSTMPGWAGSSWYFLRYMDPTNTTEFAAKKKMEYWNQVDLYIGGSEHATGHLLYSRFWAKFLHDLGYISFDEPFKKLINQGMILGNSAYVYVVIPQTQGHIPFTLSAHHGEHEEIIKLEEKYPGAQVAARKVLLIPEDIYHDIKKTGSNKEVDAWFKKQFAEFGEDMIGSYGPGNAIRTTIDVSLPEGDKLKDLDKLRQWHRQYEFAEQLVAGDYTCSREVEKMSKSKYNVQTPDELVEKFGADTLRLYEMFLGPLEQAKPWDTQGISGVHSFLRRFWRLFHNEKNDFQVSENEPEKASLKTLHKTIKKIQDDLDRFSFNTGVSNFMIATNEFTEQKCNNRSILREMLILLASYAPHISEELWEKLGEKESISYATFPKFNPEFLVESSFEYPVSFNGKMRFKLELPLALGIPEIEKEVMAQELTAKYLEGKSPKKVIIVHGKIVNIVL